MKRFILILLVVLAQVPLQEWQKIPDKGEFLRLLGHLYCTQVNPDCKKALIGAMEVGDKVLFTADCLPEERTSL